MKRIFWDLGINQAELLCLFVFGFTFLIMAIDISYGLKYFGFLSFSSILLFFIKYIDQIKNNKRGRRR